MEHHPRRSAPAGRGQQRAHLCTAHALPLAACRPVDVYVELPQPVELETIRARVADESAKAEASTPSRAPALVPRDGCEPRRGSRGRVPPSRLRCALRKVSCAASSAACGSRRLYRQTASTMSAKSSKSAPVRRPTASSRDRAPAPRPSRRAFLRSVEVMLPNVPTHDVAPRIHGADRAVPAGAIYGKRISRPEGRSTRCRWPSRPGCLRS